MWIIRLIRSRIVTYHLVQLIIFIIWLSVYRIASLIDNFLPLKIIFYSASIFSVYYICKVCKHLKVLRTSKADMIKFTYNRDLFRIHNFFLNWEKNMNTKSWTLILSVLIFLYCRLTNKRTARWKNSLRWSIILFKFSVRITFLK